MMSLINQTKFLGLFLIVILLQTSCKKALEDEQASNESIKIESFISKNKWSYTKTDGIYHVVTKSSFGYQVAKGDTIKFNFIGYTLTGLVFETNIKEIALKEKLNTLVRSFDEFKIIAGSGNLIEGLENGLLLLKEKENATIIFPSTLGYGSHAIGPVVPNSPLAFDIELISVNSAKIQEEKSYISSLNLVSQGYINDISGLHYKYNPAGLGVLPTAKDTIYGWYKGTLLDGTVIEEVETSNMMIILSSDNLLEGVKRGFLITKKGGVTELVLPSYLGFGNKGNNIVKPYETIKYSIRFDSIK